MKKGREIINTQENIKYIKSPLNYTGGKYKLLNQILPLFPNNINTFVDLFCGGGNVGINVGCRSVLYNDIETHVVDLLKYFYSNKTYTIVEQIDKLIARYNLNKTNKEGYLRLRSYYNSMDNHPIVFYTLICHAFSNQVRFNKLGEYNVPFGERNFNTSLRGKLIDFVKNIHSQSCTFNNKDFRNFTFSALDSSDLVYCDPPYLGSVATYNESNGWTEQDEKDLLYLLDGLHNKGIRFALSNNLKYENKTLDKWKEKYNVHYLSSSYSNCNYHKKDKSDGTEILITNY